MQTTLKKVGYTALVLTVGLAVQAVTPAIGQNAYPSVMDCSNAIDLQKHWCFDPRRSNPLNGN